MVYTLFFIICFGASIIGAICGIGGGVIIKPVLDATGVMDASAISFLSGCTVLSMSTYSVIKSRMSGKSEIDTRMGTFLAVGAAIGGLVGKWMFQAVLEASSDVDKAGAIQAACLLVVTIGTLIYTLRKDKIKTHKMSNAFVCSGIGIVLGILSSFLGIGGGPINLVVLYFFFSMTTKQAAENSLYIIFFSQITSLCSTFVTRTVPQVSVWIVLLMAVGGILGGMTGRALNKKLEEKTVDKLFIGLMVAMIVINIYNIYKFL